jgi:hypothetical protein
VYQGKIPIYLGIFLCFNMLMISAFSPEDNQERRGRVWADMGSLAQPAVAEVVSLEVEESADSNNEEINDQGE